MRITPRFSVLTVPSLALLLALAVGCAHANHQRPEGLAARGPGSVFPTIEAAAVDALTYAHLDGRSDVWVKRLRSGVILAADGGFTYREVRTAPERDPHRVEIELGPRAVASFRAYTRAANTSELLAVNHVREHPSRHCKRLVDKLDPLHRPAFILTPSLKVRVYRGRDEGTIQVADLRAPASERVIASRPIPQR